MKKQSTSGKAFEYGIACQLAKQLRAPIIQSPSAKHAHASLEDSDESEQYKIQLAASVITSFLIASDKYLSTAHHHEIQIQSDMQGRLGDVRDIIIHNKINNMLVGISAKNRHSAVKHSRLSHTIDFGKLWLGVPCSKAYWDAITPLFKALMLRQEKKEIWRQVDQKEEKYYLPVLMAFRDELKRLYEKASNKIATKLLHYLLGKHDFYKIVKENGTISAQSFNINGTLKWGKKIPLPLRIIEAELKPNSKTTILVVFDNGWQVSFRIHNASTKVEPSLKFDIQLIGWPTTIAKHSIEYLSVN